MGVGGQRRTSAALLRVKNQYPLYRRLGGPQDRSGRVRKISPPTGFRSLDRPVLSESLYRLSCPGPHCVTLLCPHLWICVVRMLFSSYCRFSSYVGCEADTEWRHQQNCVRASSQNYSLPGRVWARRLCRRFLFGGGGRCEVRYSYGLLQQTSKSFSISPPPCDNKCLTSLRN